MKIRDCAALAALALLAAQPAAAATITVNMSGHFTTGVDQSGYFGTPNLDLTGVAFTVAETFDTTLGVYDAIGQNQTYSGGPGFNAYASPGLATLTINGVALNFTGTSYSYITLNTGSNIGQTSFVDRDVTSGILTETSLSTRFSPADPLVLADGWSSDCAVVDLCRVAFTMGQQTDPALGDPTVYYQNVGILDHIEVSNPVPEPATWAMMILGFGLVGGALRRSRAVLA